MSSSDTSNGLAAVVREHLDTLGLVYHTGDGATPSSPPDLCHLLMQGQHGQYHVVIAPLADQPLVYLAVANYAHLDPQAPAVQSVLQRLMYFNATLHIGAFAWNPDNGEVRLTYGLPASDGLGLATFRDVFYTLLANADRLWPDVAAVLTGAAPSGA